MTLDSRWRRDSLARMAVAAHSPCAPRIPVAIADDHPVMREGLARIIADECDLAVSGSAASGAELRDLVAHQPPRVLVMDLALRGADGLALVKDLAELAPELRIVVFTMQPEEVYAARCLRVGAHAYVMKHEPVATLLRAIRDTAAGGIAAQLTDRELEVFRLAGLALPTRAIAEKLGVSVKTVETHHGNIKNKLDLQSHAELVARAAQWLREDGGA